MSATPQESCLGKKQKEKYKTVLYSYLHRREKYFNQSKDFLSDAGKNKANGIKEVYPRNFSCISKVFFQKWGRNCGKMLTSDKVG